MAARATGAQPQRAIPRARHAAARAVRRAAAPPDARRARRPHRGPKRRHRPAVRAGDRVVADTTSPLVLYESGFAPRWYVPRDDVVDEALTPAELQTFCPYKGIASYYDIDDARNAAWSYRAPFADMAAIGDLVS